MFNKFSWPVFPTGNDPITSNMSHTSLRILLWKEVGIFFSGVNCGVSVLLSIIINMKLERIIRKSQSWICGLGEIWQVRALNAVHSLLSHSNYIYCCQVCTIYNHSLHTLIWRSFLVWRSVTPSSHLTSFSISLLCLSLKRLFWLMSI